jgi:hypothetical protein
LNYFRGNTLRGVIKMTKQQKNRMCERCSNVEIGYDRRHKYCDVCKPIAKKENQKKQNDKNNKINHKHSYDKKRKELNENFLQLNLQGLDLTPNRFNEKSQYVAFSYTAHFNTDWVSVLRFYNVFDSLMNALKEGYVDYIKETGRKGLNSYAREIGILSSFFLKHIDHKEMRDFAGTKNQNDTSQEYLEANFHQISFKLGRLPFTIKEFDDNSQISFTTYLNKYSPKGVQIEGVVQYFISKEDFITYQINRRDYLGESHAKRTQDRTGRHMYSHDELKARAKIAIDEYIKEFDTIPIFREFNRVSRLGGATIKDRLNMTYYELLYDLGYEPEQGYSTERIVISSMNKLVKETPIQQASFEWLVGHKGWSLRCDAYYPAHNFILEYDGEFHFYPINGLGGEASFERMQKNDAIKNLLIPQKGIKLVRISYDEPHWDEDFILTRLFEHGIFPDGYTDVTKELCVNA